jgi:hypothetical protein
MPARAEFLRLKAKECRTVAELFKDGPARRQLLTIAEQYERLAVQHERIDKRLLLASRS